MTYTTIPSLKGQVTIPSEMRKKYNIDKDTPIRLTDKGHGIIELSVMRMMPYGEVEGYETKDEIGLTFKKGITPKSILNEINHSNGQDNQIST